MGRPNGSASEGQRFAIGGTCHSPPSPSWYRRSVPLLASCQMHGIEPWSYLRDLFCLIPSWPVKRVLELAPDNGKRLLDDTEVQQELEGNIFRRATMLDDARAAVA